MRIWRVGPVSSLIVTFVFALGGPFFEADNWRESWRASDSANSSGLFAGLWLVFFAPLAFAAAGVGVVLPFDSGAQRVVLLVAFWLAALALAGSGLYAIAHVFGVERTSGLIDTVVLVVSFAVSVWVGIGMFSDSG